MLRTGLEEAKIAPPKQNNARKSRGRGVGRGEGGGGLGEKDLAQKETTRWRRPAWRNPATQSTAAGFACEASDSMRARERDSFDFFACRFDMGEEPSTDGIFVHLYFILFYFLRNHSISCF